MKSKSSIIIPFESFFICGGDPAFLLGGKRLARGAASERRCGGDRDFARQSKKDSIRRSKRSIA